MKERRSLVLKSESSIYLSELTMRLIDQIHFSRPHPLKRVTRARASILPTIVEEVEPCTEQIQPLPPV